MFQPKRFARVLLLTSALVVTTTASGIGVPTASASPFKCVFATDGQGHVIYTVCVPWPVA